MNGLSHVVKRNERRKTSRTKIVLRNRLFYELQQDTCDERRMARKVSSLFCSFYSSAPAEKRYRPWATSDFSIKTDETHSVICIVLSDIAISIPQPKCSDLG